MKNFNGKSFIMGVVLSLLVISIFSSSSLAAVTTNWISVTNGINIYVDDVKLNAVDGNGNAVEAFISNGTTYLPVKAISEAVGKAVSWDGKTRSVYIGKHDSATPSIMLYDMNYYNRGKAFSKIKLATDSLGNNYTNAIELNYESWEEYLLNGKYRTFKGKFSIDYEGRAATLTGNLIVYGDGSILYSSPTLTGGVNPIDFNINVEGVQKLKIEFVRSAGGTSCDFYLLNAGFYQ